MMIECTWDFDIDQSGSAVLATQLAHPVSAIHWTPPSTYMQYLIPVGDPILLTSFSLGRRSLSIDEQKHLKGALMASSELLYEI